MLMQSSHFKIYLAGFIQGGECLEKCIEWRRKIRNHFLQNPKWQGEIKFLDPLNGKDLATITSDGLKSSCDPHAILHRDYAAVINSNLIIANMATFNEKRPLTGTISELSWAWEHHIPIVLISKEDIYTQHPFIKYFSSWIVGDVDELLEKKIIQYFYRGLTTASY